MKICVLGSGSRGNSIYVETGKTRILIDAGFGKRSLAKRFKQAGIKKWGLDAILLTHGHGDHVGGLPGLLRTYPVPVYMNAGTREEYPPLEELDRQELFECGQEFCIGDLAVTPFPVPHDAVEAVGFRLSAQGIQGAVATDLGEIPAGAATFMEGCDWLVIESNHDEEMVKIGPYPWSVKRRVLSNRGHLSNRSLAAFFSTRFDGGASHVFLAHLSQRNNDPDLAFESASRAISRTLPLFRQLAPQVHLTHQGKPSIVIDL